MFGRYEKEFCWSDAMNAKFHLRIIQKYSLEFACFLMNVTNGQINACVIAGSAL